VRQMWTDRDKMEWEYLMRKQKAEMSAT